MGYGVQHDGPAQDLGCDGSQPDGPADSQHDVQQHDGPRHVGNDQQPNVLQHDGLQQQAHRTAHDAADGAYSRDLHFNQDVLILNPKTSIQFKKSEQNFFVQNIGGIKYKVII